MNLHGIWHDENFPQEGNHAESWRRMNPNATIMLRTFDFGERLIAREIPWLLEHFRAFPFVIQKSNVLRIVLLYVYGGLYLDLDMECMNPLNEIGELPIFFAAHNMIDGMLCNAAMGSKRGHTFWLEILREVVNQPAVIGVSSDAIKTTGSLLITRLVRERLAGAAILPASKFFPNADEEREAYAAHRCGFPRWIGKQYHAGALLENEPWLMPA